MSNDLNRCEFIGRLGTDPEVKFLPNGDPVANLSIACSEKYTKKNGEKVENTEWVNLVAFRGLAKVIGEYLKKGSKVFVSGKYKTRKWQDIKGNNRRSTEVIIDNLQMLDSREAAAGNRGASNQNPIPANNEAAEFDDDIPFS